MILSMEGGECLSTFESVEYKILSWNKLYLIVQKIAATENPKEK